MMKKIYVVLFTLVLLLPIIAAADTIAIEEVPPDSFVESSTTVTWYNFYGKSDGSKITQRNRPEIFTQLLNSTHRVKCYSYRLVSISITVNSLYEVGLNDTKLNMTELTVYYFTSVVLFGNTSVGESYFTYVSGHSYKLSNYDLYFLVPREEVAIRINCGAQYFDAKVIVEFNWRITKYYEYIIHETPILVQAGIAFGIAISLTAVIMAVYFIVQKLRGNQ
jgi:hypothetical protein